MYPLRDEVHLQELEADDWQRAQVEALGRDQLREELADFLEVKDRDAHILSLASGVAPGEELNEVALDRRRDKQVVYDLELCLRDLEVRVNGKLLQK